MRKSRRALWLAQPILSEVGVKKIPILFVSYINFFKSYNSRPLSFDIQSLLIVEKYKEKYSCYNLVTFYPNCKKSIINIKCVFYKKKIN
jgi:hypothetical protein